MRISDPFEMYFYNPFKLVFNLGITSNKHLEKHPDGEFIRWELHLGLGLIGLRFNSYHQIS